MHRQTKARMNVKLAGQSTAAFDVSVRAKSAALGWDLP